VQRPSSGFIPWHFQRSTTPAGWQWIVAPVDALGDTSPRPAVRPALVEGDDGERDDIDPDLPDIQPQQIHDLSASASAGGGGGGGSSGATSSNSANPAGGRVPAALFLILGTLWMFLFLRTIKKGQHMNGQTMTCKLFAVSMV